MIKIIKTPTLETERLVLRPADLQYADNLEKHFNNWNIIECLNDRVPWPYPKGGTSDFIKNDMLPRIQNNEAVIWFLFLKEKPNNPIGVLEYRIKKKEGYHEEDRGFWLAESFWGNGLMSEAVECGNDYIFREIGLQKLDLQNYKDNRGSHRVKEKTGAQLIRTEIQKWRGKDRKVEIWELTADNWRKFKSQNS